MVRTASLEYIIDPALRRAVAGILDGEYREGGYVPGAPDLSDDLNTEYGSSDPDMLVMDLRALERHRRPED